MGKTYGDRCYKDYSEYQRMPNSARKRKRKELEVIQNAQTEEELMEKVTFKFNYLALMGIGFVSTLSLPIATRIILSILLLGTGCSIFINTEKK